jgi:hypothetical protein
MRECQQCGEGNQVSSRFCVVCGTPLAAAGVAGGASPVGAVAGRSAHQPLPPAAPALAAPPAGPAYAPVFAAAPAAPAAYAAPVVVAAPHVPAHHVVAQNAANPAYTPGSPGGTGRPAAPLPASGGRDLAIDFPLDGPRTLVGFLVSYENVEIGQYWPIHQGRNVLGRQGAATGLDVEISHPTTSSLHALLLATARPGRIVVEDTSSTNGTFVNDNMLAPGQRWELRDGDRVRFGLFDTVIKIVDKT